MATNPDYATNELRVRNRSRLLPELESVLLGKSLGEWEELFAASGFPHGAVNSLERVFSDPHVRHTEMVRQVHHEGLGTTVKQVAPAVKYSQIRNEVRSAPPSLGAHTDQVSALVY